MNAPLERPSRAEAVVTVELDGEAVLFHEATEELVRLDPVGTVVWSVLDGKTALADLVADLAWAYEADPADVERDVRAMLEQLRSQGLVTEAGPCGHGPAGAPRHD